MPTAPPIEQTRAKVAEAVVGPEVGPVIGRALTPVEKEIQRIQEKLKESPREGTEAMATIPPIDALKRSRSSEKYDITHGDGTVDKVTHARLKTQEERAMKTIAEMVDKRGFTPGVKQAVFEGVMQVPQVKKYLEALAGVAPGALTAANPAIENALRKIAENPTLLMSVHSGAEDLLEGNVASQLAEKERLRTTAEQKRDAIRREKDDRESEFANVEADYAAFKPGGLKDVRMKTLQGTEEADKAKVDPVQSQIDDKNRQITDLETDRAAARVREAKGLTATPSAADLDAQIGVLKGEIGTLEGGITAEKSRLQELQSLRTRKGELKTEYDRLNPEVTRLQKEFSDAVNALHAANADVNSESIDLERQLQARVDNFQKLISEKTAELLTAEIQHGVTLEQRNYQESLTKAAEAGDKHANEMLKLLNNRWSEIPGIVTPRDRIEPDLNNLLASQDQFVRGLFQETDYTTSPPTIRNRINPETGSTYTTPEIDEKLADKAFMERVAGPASVNMLQKALREGMVDASMAERIWASEGGEAALQSALEKNKAAQEFMKNFEKEHDSDWKDILKKNPRFKIWLLMMILSPGLGTLFGLGVLGADMISKTKQANKSEGEGH